jgi:hypothetical protein
MPIEIKELHIKINVKGGDQAPQDDGGKDKGQVVQECLDHVMKILNNKEER